MEKQKWFQLIQQGKSVIEYTSSWSKTRTFWFVIGIVLAIAGYTAYDKISRQLFLANSQRIIDSLNLEINAKNRQYDELSKKADELDLKLEEERKRTTTVINNFASVQRPEIKNQDSAISFIYNFIGR